MPKGKYEYWCTAEGLLLLEGYARDGFTDDQISKKIGVSRSTLSAWKVRFSDISDALKKGKEVVDREVENALHKKCLGYNVELKKTFKVKVVDYDPQTGKKTSEREELKIGIDEVHIPADTTAQIFWLKNRQPEKWRQNPQADDSESASCLADAISEAWKRRMGK